MNATRTDRLTQAFIGAKLLPNDTLPLPPKETLANRDLLPVLHERWNAPGHTQQCPSQQPDAWITSGIESTAQLTLGFRHSLEIEEPWIGQRLAYWPDGACRPARLVSLISSRLGRKLESRRTVFDALRTTGMQLDPSNDALLAVSGTTLARFIERCGQLFAIPVLRMECPPRRNQSLGRWLRSLRAIGPSGATSGIVRVLLSPRIDAASPSDATGSGMLNDSDASSNIEFAKKPPFAIETAVAARGDRDAVATFSADHVRVLHLRPGGTVERLIRVRLTDRSFPPASVFVSIGDDRVAPAAASELQQLGAIGWVLLDPIRDAQRTHGQDAHGQDAGSLHDADSNATESQSPVHVSSTRTSMDAADHSSSTRRDNRIIHATPPVDVHDWLSHCTRRQDRPWPDQPETDYLDDLILDRTGADHSAFAALWRIVRDRRLIATSAAHRGGFPSVSLTEVPVDELAGLRAFRSHRGRWDFEPYGVCIRRTALARIGTRPVIYGDASLWNTLSEDDQPFFQVSRSHGRDGTIDIDWTMEREWRCPIDLDLNQFSKDDVNVFVPTFNEAESFLEISPWPVMVVPQ